MNLVDDLNHNELDCDSRLFYLLSLIHGFIYRLRCVF